MQLLKRASDHRTVDTLAARIALWCRSKLRASKTLAVVFLFLNVIVSYEPVRAEVTIASERLEDQLLVNAPEGQHWTEGVYEVWSLSGGCEIVQGNVRLTSRDAVIWIEKENPATGAPWRMLTYLENEVVIFQKPSDSKADVPTLQPADVKRSKDWFGKLCSTRAPLIRTTLKEAAVQGGVGNGSAVKPAVYDRAVKQLGPANNSGFLSSGSLTQAAPNQATDPSSQSTNAIKRTQFAEPGSTSSRGVPPPVVTNPGTRRIQYSSRSAVPHNIEIIPTSNGETVAIFDSGIQVRIDGLAEMDPRFGDVGTLDISADKVVVWTRGSLTSGALQSSDTPLEIYMEGDIIFREGDRIIFAQAMYYNVPLRTGTILSAELRMPINLPTKSNSRRPRGEAEPVGPAANYEGVARLRANVIRQVNESTFVAEGASLTTSRLALPRYEFRSGTLTMTDIPHPMVDPITGAPVIDPETGKIQNEHEQFVESKNNVVFIDGLPILYWPTMATSLEEPTFYVKDINVGNDNIFGTRATVTFDAYQLFGIRNRPKGSNWELDAGYMTDRGFTTGSRYNYDMPLFDQMQHGRGLFDSMYVHDEGLDTLGRDRMNMTPEATERYRILGKHRQMLDSGWQVTAELGLLSDRNFLEQYKEREWDDQKDLATGLELKRTMENRSLAFSLDYNPNNFFLREQQLPRLDYFVIGQSIFEDRLTTYGHISGAYFRQDIAKTPQDPKDLATFAPLPYEVDAQGERFAWRQALEFPIPMMDIKLVPFILGEGADWGDDLSGDRVQRVYGQAGVRTSLPFSGIFPTVESDLFNVHGMAHKANFDIEYSYTDSSRNVDELALYDEIDDDNVQHFRRRIPFLDFAGPGTLPTKFDERFYGVRRGLMDNVTGPVEIADDLQVFRFGLRQRLQTKRGPEANRRTIDWVVFDTHFEVFPNEDDNFGEKAGLLDYNFIWHVGDRVALLSSGAFDFFGDGQRMVTLGASLSRPQRGNIYVGVRSLEGPISNNVLLSTINYRLSDKWAASAGVSFNLSEKSYLGETFSVTRIGESFLFTAAFTADQSRDNVGVGIFFEPRFLPRTQFGKKTGLSLPLGGQYGFE